MKSDEGSLSQEISHSEAQDVVPLVEPSSPHAEIFEQMEAISESTDVHESKKPRRKNSEFLGSKKSK